MRAFVSIVFIASAVSFLYKWRYRVMNALLAIGIIRKLAVKISMNLPGLRAKLLPSLFRNEM
ncbi:hypothetical protein [Oceanobacillus bengalensis]|uniref:Uncharacterized protein n=1 Tax=Oceanobacillus bengalensis TaxID=1435466 RepID=A0A494Z5I8_9BACI|nr:hypothetical protein [Oceanobacillus bengalensis]RKQ17819.1 hypothetical protein D8M05_02715 [Oceanobacillus bengalensis]